ncbi:MAG: RagB/SusD family protein, partial [Ginsengibacter sp.]
SLNPVFETATSTNNVVQVKDSALGLPPALAPDLSDGRVPFYTSINPTIAPRFRIKGFFDGTSTPIPVYLPGEMQLIKAEVYARQNDSTQSKVFLNAVVTKSSDPFNVAANLPAITSVNSYANLLDQIYRNRCIELYMSGLKLEDMRRFNRPVSERKRSYLPYPFRERDNNPNTPVDPAF